MGRRLLASWLLCAWMGIQAAAAAAAPPAKPGPRDTCPVCGMLVSKYPNWVAVVQWKDGHVHFFDGAKDMFKFLQDLPKYAPGHRPGDIEAILVTDFYNLRRVDARKALFVLGSDVLGPMGHELVPQADRLDAEEFLKDHKGKRIVDFGQVTPALIRQLDAD